MVVTMVVLFLMSRLMVCDDGSSLSYVPINGCDDGSSLSYVSIDGCDDGSSLSYVSINGCDDGSSLSYVSINGCDDGSSLSSRKLPVRSFCEEIFRCSSSWTFCWQSEDMTQELPSSFGDRPRDWQCVCLLVQFLVADLVRPSDSHHFPELSPVEAGNVLLVCFRHTPGT